jgi:hypothetical protein
MKQIPEEIREYLEYNALTGILTWIKSPSKKIKAGTIAGTINKHGYIQVKFKDTLYQAHRICWFLHTGKQPTKQIDHRNEVKTCNIFTNMREATNSQNNSNISKLVNNTSGYKGVSWHKGTNKWRAQIKKDNKVIYLGLFNDPEEAHKVYCEYANNLHKEFANYG